MLRPSRVSAALGVDQIPLLPGAAELFAEGLESTLAPANRTVAGDMDLANESSAAPRLAPLFDPQTCGGLIFGVPPDQVQDVLARLALSPTSSAVIGRVVVPSNASLIRLVLDSGRPGMIGPKHDQGGGEHAGGL